MNSSNNNTQQAHSARRIAGWAGVLAAPFGLFNIISFLTVTGGKTEALLDPAFALALPASAQALFTVSMVVDALGFYLLPAMLALHLASRVPAEHAARAALALPCILVYAVLGMLGALLQMAALPALAAAQTAGLAGAASAWTAIVCVAQGGFWWFQMLPFAIAALCLGPTLRAAGFGFGRTLTTTGWMSLVYWVLSFPGLAERVPAAGMAAELIGLVILLTVLCWSLLSGWALLGKEDGPLSSSAGDSARRSAV